MTGSSTSVDWKHVRDDFPILRREIDGAPIVYLDSGNTSQKPYPVIEAMDTFQRTQLQFYHDLAHLPTPPWFNPVRIHFNRNQKIPV
jgi:selenocysteine lyase/cysteine desulfurase